MENLINTVKLFILNPKEAWEAEKEKTTTVTTLFTSYILILALIPAVCSFIGYGLIGIRIGFLGRTASIAWGLNSALTSYVSSVIGIYISAWVIQMLSSKFDCSVKMEKAVALVGLSYIPAFVAGLFNLVPTLSILAFLGSLYSLYVLYIGFVPMTGVSENKKSAYFITSLVVVILVYIVLGLVLASLFTAFGLKTFAFR